MSRTFLPTLREAPADAIVPSHQLLLRAGLVRQLGAGLYSLLPLALRAVHKIEAIVRQEMTAISAVEFLLPALHPASIWRETGRWDSMGDNLFRLQDRKGADHCLGMTHEEIFTAIARDELRSWRDLPQVWYQIAPKFRDEPRPKSGLLRVRQFTMKDAYSFDIDTDGLDRAFEDQRRAYHRIFQRCGLRFLAVDAHSGAMGGSASTEFMVPTEAGEDHIASCAGCGYAANVEKAVSRLPPVDSAGECYGQPTERFATPGVRTIEDLERPPYDVPAVRQLKTLVVVADGAPVIAVLRGDHSLNEAKLQTATGAAEIRPAHEEEIIALLGARPGSLGAVGTAGLGVRLLVDAALQGGCDRVTGANADGYHLRHVDVDRDLAHGTLADLRTVCAGEACVRCGAALEVGKGLEIGHIFKLGTRYSAAMGASVLDAEGRSVPIVMGSYGIGIERILASAIELHHDERGIRWPISIAPYSVALLSLQPEDDAVVAAADALYQELSARGIDVLYDDRDLRPGVKFNDADLIGLPFRIAVGKKSLAEGSAECKRRTDEAALRVALGLVVAHTERQIAAMQDALAPQ